MTALRKKMKKFSDKLEFEEAAKIRDEIKRFQMEELKGLSGSVENELDKVLSGQDV